MLAVGGNEVPIGVPGGVPDQRHGEYETDEGRRKADGGENRDTGSPQQYRTRIAATGEQAGDCRGHRIRLAVQHQRHGNHTDREDKGGKETTDGEVDEGKVDLFEGQDRPYDIRKSW